MTVLSNDNRIDYVADGVQTVFAYNYLLLDGDHMVVYLDDVDTAAGWTVDGVANPAGGNVTFGVAPANGVAVSLRREVPLTQEVDYTEFDAFPAEVHERALDLGIMVAQQQDELLARVPRYRLADVPAGGLTLPTPVPFRAWGYDVNGDLTLLEVGEGGDLVVTPLSADLETSAFGISITDGADPEVELGRLAADAGLTKAELSAVVELLLTSPLVTVSGILNAATLQQGGTSVADLIAADIAAHEAEADPHPGYLTPAEGNAAYDPLGSAAVVDAALDAHTGDASIHFEDAPADAVEYIRKNNAWAAFTALANPMTTPEDIIVGGVAGAATRLALGDEGRVLGRLGGVVDYTDRWTRVGPIALVGLRFVNFTDIPDWANNIVLVLSYASKGGTTDRPFFQIGSGGVQETAGYAGAVSNHSGSTCNIVSAGYFDLTPIGFSGANSYHGNVHLSRVDAVTSERWSASWVLGLGNANAMVFGGGSKIMSGGALDMLRFGVTGATDSFTSGVATLLYS